MHDVLFTPGMRIRVTHRVPRQTGDLVATIEGVVVRAAREKTGSWFAHERDHRVWIDRLELRKDSGESAVINLDRHTSVEILDAAGAGESAAS